MVGPFIKYGPETVEACLAAGTHYLDTTGEQDWMLLAQEKWGDAFAKKGLLLSPCVAQMYTTGEIAANIALETMPGLDTLDMLVLWKGFPTYASVQTIFTILKADWYFLENNQYVQWPTMTATECHVPGQHATALTLPWGGTSHLIWFKHDPRVSTVKVYGGVFAREVMDNVVNMTKMIDTDIKPLPFAEQEAALSKMAETVQGDMPPREKPAAQHQHRLGPCVGPARPRACADPRQLQLQADRADAGVGGDEPAPAAAAPHRLRLGMPGVRASRDPGCAAPVRAGAEAGRHGRRLRGRAAMRLVDWLDKGASLGPDAPCLTMDGKSLSYAEVQAFTHRAARGLNGAGILPGKHVAILSGNDPVAFACVFAISRAAAVWCPVNPRNEAAENAYVLDNFDCAALFFHSKFADLVDALQKDLPKLEVLVCLNAEQPFAPSLDEWLAGVAEVPFAATPVSDLCDAARNRRHDGAPQGSDADQPQPRGDDRADPDGLSVRWAASLSRDGAAHPRGGGAGLSDHGAWRRDRDHALSRYRRIPDARVAAHARRTASCRRR